MTRGQRDDRLTMVFVNAPVPTSYAPIPARRNL